MSQHASGPIITRHGPQLLGVPQMDFAAAADVPIEADGDRDVESSVASCSIIQSHDVHTPRGYRPGERSSGATCPGLPQHAQRLESGQGGVRADAGPFHHASFSGPLIDRFQSETASGYLRADGLNLQPLR